MQFEEFPKIGRLTRECVITEKIDGTNAQIAIVRPTDPSDLTLARIAIAVDPEAGLVMLAGSRTQWITPERDNFGFAGWVQAHARELWALGEGRHFGEWWGSGIQRGYGLPKGEKRFSLFNVSRWADQNAGDGLRTLAEKQSWAPPCCHVVPELYRGLFGDRIVDNMIAKLRAEGSQAAPGFMNPEGVVVFHTATGVMFKKTLERDEEPKTAPRSQQQSEGVGAKA